MSLASVFLFFFVSVLSRRLCVALSSFAYVVVAWIRITLMFPRVITLSFFLLEGFEVPTNAPRSA